MLDFHNHIIPGVDDGAADLPQSLDALRALSAQGVRTVIATPHVQGSLAREADAFAQRMAEIDAAWDTLRNSVERELPDLRVERGAEVMLDHPEPELSDPRLRLAGTSFVLVEFAQLMVPPRSIEVLAKLSRQGVRPILAHPERYSGIRRELDLVEEWRYAGCRMQVNSGSLLGRYGEAARDTALELLTRGWIDYLSSDYHARGQPRVEAARQLLLQMGGREQVELLTVENPGRILRDENPLEVPPLQAHDSWWGRLRRMFR